MTTEQNDIYKLAVLIDGVVGELLSNTDNFDFSIMKLLEIRERANEIARTNLSETPFDPGVVDQSYDPPPSTA